MNSESRVCLVTGAANGLGAAMALGLAQHGARIVAADRDAQGLQRLTQSLQDQGLPPCVGVEADMSDPVAADRIVAAALGRFGRIDVVINNAGTGAQLVRPDFITNPLKSWHVSPEHWRKIIEINALGPFYLSRAALPHLLAQGWGRLIYVSTTWETMLRAGFASYGASKAALEATAAGLAKELAGTGITVNTIIPGGPVDTAQVPADIGVDRRKLLRPDVMNPAILWLTSTAADNVSAMRLTASAWNPARSDSDNLTAAAEPVAWPQLVKPLVMAERGNLT